MLKLSPKWNDSLGKGVGEGVSGGLGGSSVGDSLGRIVSLGSGLTVSGPTGEEALVGPTMIPPGAFVAPASGSITTVGLACPMSSSKPPSQALVAKSRKGMMARVVRVRFIPEGGGHGDLHIQGTGFPGFQQGSS
jgi:hypothetical protein